MILSVLVLKRKKIIMEYSNSMSKHSEFTHTILSKLRNEPGKYLLEYSK